MKKISLAIFASGNGSNAEKIISYFKNHPTIHITAVYYNKIDAGVKSIAEKNEIQAVYFSRDEFYNGVVCKELVAKNIDYIVLAGFLWLIPTELIHQFENKIINIHPSLLPKFGGKGMYGKKVHETVRLSDEKETGITIHLVNEEYDKGKILAQYITKIEDIDTVEDIQQKVQVLEHTYFPSTIEKWILSNN